MRADEAIFEIQENWTFVMQQGAMLALFPIEDWLEGLDRAEAIAPIIDPTLYRDSIYSGKPKLIREVLEGALVFKRAILKAQTEVLANPRLR